tara:strand:- start:177 stop:308 length:132 start_codon:yes stop_codon:yes gene_type:complete
MVLLLILYLIEDWMLIYDGTEVKMNLLLEVVMTQMQAEVDGDI